MRIEPGTMFGGQYRIERELGAGGFARVYLARDGGGELVAVKVLTPDRNGTYDEGLRRRFLRESEVLGSIEHPAVVRLVGAGEENGLLFLVTEYVPGTDLAELLRERGHLHPTQAVHVLMQLLSALAAAHRAGLVHRDIKPENIRVSPTDADPLRVKLLDFGIARATDDGAPALTKTGELIGTPRYMAPEQLRGRPTTPASDIYALGLVGYELLLGRDALHGGALGDQFERLLTHHMVAVARQDEITPGLRETLQRMTATKPADRFASADAVMHALSGPGPAAPVGRETASRPMVEQANRRLAIVGAALIVVVSLGFAASMRRSADAPDPETTAPTTLEARPSSNVEPESKLVPDETGIDEPDTGAVDASEVLPAWASAGCGAEKQDVELPDAAWFVPPVCDARLCPLVLAFHGNYMDHHAWLHGQLEDLATREGFIIVAPFGGKGDRAWRDAPDRNVVEARNAFEFATGRFCVDLTRVFLLGYSDGTDAVMHSSCEDWVTAAAAFGLSFNEPGGSEEPGFTCRDPRRPFLWLHPQSSGQVPLETGPTCTARSRNKLGYHDTMGFLRRLHGCAKDRTPTQLSGGATCETWRCDVALTGCRVVGGRVWPGVKLNPFDSMAKGCDPSTNARADIGAAMWRFFESSPPLRWDEGDAD